MPTPPTDTWAEVSWDPIPFEATADNMDRGRSVISVGGGTLDLWGGRFKTTDLLRADLVAWNVFITDMRLDGTFTLTNPARPTPGSTDASVDGAGQSGFTLNVSNLSGPVTAGTEFVVNGEYKRLVETPTLTGDRATLRFWPILRASPANLATVNFTTPSITARFEGNLEPVRYPNVLLARPVTFDWIEVL